MRIVLMTAVMLWQLLPGLVLAQSAPVPPKPGLLGIEMRDLTKQDADAAALDEPAGVLVIKPMPGGPAETAGILAGDVILSIDGVEINGMEPFRGAVGAKGAGTAVRFRIVRGGRQRTITVTLAERPGEPKAPQGPSPLRLMLDNGGHQAIIKGLDWTPDSRQIVSAGDDKVIRVWDAATGRTVRTIRGEVGPGFEGKIYTLALSPDGKWLAAGGWMNSECVGRCGDIRLYDFASGKIVAILEGHSNVVYGLAFSRSGTHLISGSGDNTVLIWDVAAAMTPGASVPTKTSAGAPRSPGGGAGTPSGGAGTPRVPSFAGMTAEVDPTRFISPLHRLLGHTAEIYAVGFTADGSRAISGSFDKTVRVWDVATGQPLGAPLIGHADHIFALAVHPRDPIVATGAPDGEIRIWDVGGKATAPSRQAFVLGNFKPGVAALRFSNDGRQLLSTPGFRHPIEVHLWDIATRTGRVVYSAHNNVVGAISFSPDGRWVATGGGMSFPIHIWDSGLAGTVGAGESAGSANRIGERRIGPDGQPLTLIGAGAPGWSAAFSADGQSIAWGGIHTSRINEAGPLEYKLRLPLAGAAPMVGAAPREGAPKLRDDGADATLLAEPEWIGTPAASPAVVAREGDWLRARVQYGPWSLEQRAGGRYGFAASVLDIRRDGVVAASITRGPADGFQHRSFTFVPDGSALVSGGDSGRMIAYDLTGKALAEFVGHEGDVWAVTPSPDGRYLVSGSDDQTIRLWPLGALKDADVVPVVVDGVSVPTKKITPIVSLYHGRDGQWVMWTPEGYYTGSAEADRLIGWQLNKGPDRTPEYFAASQLRQQFNRPDIVAKAIRLASSDAAVSSSLGTSYRLEDLIRRPPPRLAITSPRPQATISGGRAVVGLRIDATPDPVKRLTVRVNGRVTTEQAPERAEGNIELRVPMAKGENRITVAAGNDVGETTAEVIVSHPGDGVLDQRGTLYIVAIGVDRYSAMACGPNRDQSCDLAYSSRDAAMFAATIEQAMGPAHARTEATILSNAPGQRPPTAANVRQALSRVRNVAKETDTLVVFTAGHGINDGPDYLFLTTDATRQGEGFDGATVVAWTDIERAVFGAKGRRFLFVDTCHSAGAYNVKLGREALHNDVTAFTATGQGEEAVELVALQQGVFTYTIRRGLIDERKAADQRGQGVITASALAEFLRRKTDQLISEHWPTFETDKGLRRPSPKLYRARDAIDHVIASTD